MLGRIHAVTFAAADLAAVEAAYTGWLGYRVAEDRAVTKTEAALWQAPAAAGKRLLRLIPESGHDTSLRFVEQPDAVVPPPFATLGWNATEIVIQDLAAMGEKLARPDSPFRVIGPPAVLDFDFTDAIAAMQAVGPAGEVIYLTEISAPVPGFELPKAMSPVDRVFVVILAGHAVGTLSAFFEQRFGSDKAFELQTKVDIIARAHGLPEDSKYTLGTVGLQAETLIELDAFPAAVAKRAVPPGGLPGPQAMLTLGIADLDAVAGHLDGGIAEIEGQRRGLMRAPHGALLELVQAG